MPDKDTLTLSLRIHDAAERKNPAKSTGWSVLDVPREDFKLSDAEFLAKNIAPLLAAIRERMELKA